MSWRPFEPSREAVDAARKYNRCNLHNDCEAADAKVRAEGGRRNQYTGELIMTAYHCTVDDCEDCFGC